MYSRSAKGGEKGDQNRNPWLAKMRLLKCPFKPESERSCICVLMVSILPLSTILIFDFEIVPTVWYYSCFFLSDLHRWYNDKGTALVV